MTIQELTYLIETKFGESVPVFFHHLLVDYDEELPPVYIITDSEDINPFRADNTNYFVQVQNTATIWSSRYDETLLVKMDAVLTEASIPYNRTTDYDETTMMFYTEYTLELDN